MNIEDLVTFEVNGKKCVALVRTDDPTRADRLMQVAEFVGDTGGTDGRGIVETTLTPT